MSASTELRLWISVRELPRGVARFYLRARRQARRSGERFSLDSAARPQELAELLSLAAGRRAVVELGTGTAWSTIALALADPARRVISYDPELRPEREAYLDLAGAAVRERIELRGEADTAGRGPRRSPRGRPAGGVPVHRLAARARARGGGLPCVAGRARGGRGGGLPRLRPSGLPGGGPGGVRPGVGRAPQRRAVRLAGPRALEHQGDHRPGSRQARAPGQAVRGHGPAGSGVSGGGDVAGHVARVLHRPAVGHVVTGDHAEPGEASLFLDDDLVGVQPGLDDDVHAEHR